MLAENLVEKPSEQYSAPEKPSIADRAGDDANTPLQDDVGKQNHFVRLLKKNLSSRRVFLSNFRLIV